MSLRPYQLEALESIRVHFAQGTRRVLLWLPTGAGKTKTFVRIMELAKAKRNKTLMVTRGKKLVTQCAETLEKEGMTFGVIMAGDPRENSKELIQIASIDTLFVRNLVPDVDIVVIDEVHLALSGSFSWLLSKLKDPYILGVTATPFHKAGFRSVADVIVEPTNVKELIAQGYLVPAKYFSPSVPDLSTVKKSEKDFNMKDLAAVCNQSRLFGDIVGSYKTHGEGRPALLFAVNVEHSKRLSLAFSDAGIPSRHIDAGNDKASRDRAIDLLMEGGIKVLCSVGILGTGTDIPPVSCLIICRPTMSLCLHLQQLGRGSRPFPGKKDFIVLDHASNVLRFGFYETHRAATLDGKEPVVRLDLTVCKKCFSTFRRSDGACRGELPDGSVCGVKPEPKPQPRQIKIDETVQLTELSAQELEKRQFQKYVLKTITDACEAGRKPGFAFMQIKARYGIDAAKGCWPIIREIYA